MAELVADTPWHRSEFREQAHAWIRDRLALHGLTLRGDVEQIHIAWWSTVMRVPTDAGTLWFKAVRPKDAFEARLTPLLASVAPGQIVEVVDADADRGWMLTRDAGSGLRDMEDGVPAVEHWERLLPRYAELQLAMADRAQELLAMGVADLRLSVLPGELATLLDEPEMLLLGKPDGLSMPDRDRLRADLPAFADLCVRLADAGIPETLQHDDLNDGNVFVRNGDHVVFDWGDACVSHPFHTLVVTLRAGAYRHGWQPGGHEVQRLLAAYLEPWRACATQAQLQAAVDIARRVGNVQRAMSWRRAVRDMPPGVAEEYVDAVPYGLRLYLMDGPWGTWDDGSF